MSSQSSRAESELFSTVRSHAGMLALALALLTLLTTAVAAGIAFGQFRDAKRAFALNAVATTVSLYAAPKSRYYDVLFENAHLFLDDDTQSSTPGPDPDYIAMLANLNLRDYLHGIEIACSVYFDGFLDEEQRQFIANYVKADIDLLLYSYDAEYGYVGSFAESLVSVPWMTPDLQSTDSSQAYEATGKCLEEWQVELRRKSIF